MYQRCVGTNGMCHSTFKQQCQNDRCQCCNIKIASMGATIPYCKINKMANWMIESKWQAGSPDLDLTWTSVQFLSKMDLTRTWLEHSKMWWTCTLGGVRKTFFKSFPAINQIIIWFGAVMTPRNFGCWKMIFSFTESRLKMTQNYWKSAKTW